MASPLKDIYSLKYITLLANTIKEAQENFDKKAFVDSVQDKHWPARELKARMHHITHCLHQHINLPYLDALSILKQACPPFGGYHGMFFPDFVEQYGIDYWHDSINALEYFTQFSSSEFAVRAFIRTDQTRMMGQMEKWTRHENHHVRRLASEGCRPRLPWATFLPSLQNDPRPILPILENLQQDESIYVRKSVANNLNDITKSHPDLVLELASSWKNKHPYTDWILKRACRSLFKQADINALAMFEYRTASHVKTHAFSCQKQIRIGDFLTMTLELQSKHPMGLLRIEYSIDFLRENGKYSKKIFQWKEKFFAENHARLTKKHVFLPLNTRKLYSGKHELCVRINGDQVIRHSFNLLPRVE